MKDSEKKIVYISGGITGVKDYRKHFRKAERKLKKLGYKVFNPCCIPAIFNSWEDYMHIDLAALERCNAIYMLVGWGKSKGAFEELKHAKQLELEVMYE